MWKVYTDGGCKPNPGKGAYSAALFKDNVLIESVGGYLQDTTNNKAEYRACYAGLQLVNEYCQCDDDIEMNLDSQLVIKHLTGEWKLKDESLKDSYLKCFDIITTFNNLHFTWVKGHSGNTGNEYVDSVCTFFIQSSSQSISNSNTSSMNPDKPPKNLHKPAKIFLNCPYADKDVAKSFGAKWDAKSKKWWIHNNCENLEIFAKWIE